MAHNGCQRPTVSLGRTERLVHARRQRLAPSRRKLRRGRFGGEPDDENSAVATAPYTLSDPQQELGRTQGCETEHLGEPLAQSICRILAGIPTLANWFTSTSAVRTV